MVHFFTKMEHGKTIMIANRMKAVVKGNQLLTTIIFTVDDNSFSLDIDRWTELKQSIQCIDEEFKKRFNAQTVEPTLEDHAEFDG